MGDEESRTVWVGNLDSEQVTEDVLYELFLQAGPLQCVRIPKDKVTGRVKNFAFVIYRDSVSVPYAIELMNGISLFNRSMRVQNRALLEMQQKGCAPWPGGIHTLNPNAQDDNPYNVQRNPQQQISCAQQYSHMSPMGIQTSPMGMQRTPMGMQRTPMGMQRTPMGMQGPPMGMQGGTSSLLGAPPGNFGMLPGQQGSVGVSPNVQSALRGQVPQHIMELAQKQIAMLQAQQPSLLSDNPLLNAPSMHMSDRLGSLSSGMYNQDRRSDMHRSESRYSDNRSGGSRPGDSSRSSEDRHSRHHDDRYRSSGSFDSHHNHHDRNRSSGSFDSHHNHHDRNRSSRSSDGQHHDDRNRHPRSSESHRSGSQKYVDNDTMKAFKARCNDQAEDSISQNSHMLAHLQKQQGRFDYNRLGPRGDGYKRENGPDSQRSNNPNFDMRNQPRYNDHLQPYSRPRGDDNRFSGSRYDPYRSSRR